MKIRYFFLFVCFGFASCANNSSKEQKKSEIDLHENSCLQTAGSDTLTLIYLAFACDCPAWMEYEYFKKSYSASRAENSNDHANLYYIEPFCDEINLKNNEQYSNRVITKLVGKIDTNKRLPKDYSHDSPKNSQIKWKTFVYSKFTILDSVILD